MESDAVRTVGDSTVVDIWVRGKFRSVAVPRDAITSFLALSPEGALVLTDHDRREFVRRHLRLIAAAAAVAVDEAGPHADSIVIDAELLRRHGGETVAERRQAARP